MQAYKPLSFKRPSSVWSNKQKTGPLSSSRQDEGQSIKETSNERMALLHSRLQQEAEKIRKWKNATELEIQQKNHQIQTSQQLIDKQHKSLIEVQLQNESLNSRIEEEMTNQKELQRKICSTREMCHALKEHVCKVESAVQQGENDRKDIIEHSTLVDTQYTELLSQFQSLEKEQSLVYESLKDKIEKEKYKNEQLSVQLSELSTVSEEQIQRLEGELKIMTNQFEELKGVCNGRSQQLENLQTEMSELEEKLKHKDSCLQERETEVNYKDKEIAEKQVENQQLKDSIETLHKEVSDLQSLYSKGQECVVELTDVHQMREKELLLLQDKLETQLQEHSLKITELEYQLNISEKDKSVLEEEQNTLLVKLESSEVKSCEVEKQLTNTTNNLKELEQEHFSLKDKLASMHDELLTLQSKLEEKENEKETLKNDLEKSLKENAEEVANLKDTLFSTETALSSVQNEVDSTLLEVKEKEEIILEQNKEIESLEETLKIKEEEKLLTLQVASDEIAHNKNTEQELIKKNEELKKELSRLMSESAQKIDDLKLEVESQNKSISNLRLELSELSSHSKTEKIYHEKQFQSFAQEKKEFEEKVKELSQQLKCWQSKENEAKKGMDDLAKEMALTLEKYQAENSHIVEQKDKDIEHLKEAKKHAVKEKEELDKRVTDLENEICALHQERKEDSAEDIEQYRLEIEKLKAQLQDKDNEMSQLIVAASTLKAQVNSPRSRPATQLTTSKQYKDVSTSITGTPVRAQVLSKTSTLSHTTTTPKTSSYSSIAAPFHSSTTTTSNNKTMSRSPQSITQRVASLQEKRRLKEIQTEQDTVFKKPKTKATEKMMPPSGILQQNRSSSILHKAGNNTRTTHKRTPRKSITATTNKRPSDKKENLSWFDSDPIFGFLDD